MKKYTRKLLDKALDSIEAAEMLLENGKSDIGAGRAYYAMFYVAEALLNEKEMQFGKHSAVHAAYGEHFAKTKALDPKYHRWLLDSFDKRIVGDYGVESGIEKDIAANMVNQAREFLQVAGAYLEKQDR